MIEILNEIAKMSPLIGLLIAAVVYFFQKEKGYKEEITALNATLRETERENLSALYKMTTVLEKIAGDSISNNAMLRQEIQILKAAIEDKIENLCRTRDQR